MIKKDSRYFRLGLTLLTVILLSVLFYVVVTHLGAVYGAVKDLLRILSPVIYGAVLAYLLNPLMKLVERGVERAFGKSNITERGLKRLKRALGVIVSLVVFVLIVYGIFAMVVPQLAESLEDLFSTENLQSFYDRLTTWLNNIAKGTPFEEWIQEHDPIRALQDWLTKELDLLNTISVAFSEAYNIVRVLINIVLGFVVAIYLLISKEKFQAQSKKLVVATFRAQIADRILEISRLTNRCLGGFIVGKLIDSSIVGILSYIGMIILGLPYALVASVFVGITNVIPFFGPLIGIVIGGLLILLQDPMSALYFVIFEEILQQIDGNIIGPRILGGRLGISDFWVLVSITLFAGLFGFAGMVVGVPVFTVIYALISEAINRSLKKKELPEATDAYYSIRTVSDLEEYEREVGEPTVFYSGDTYETEYDPDEDFEFDDPDD